MSVPFRHRVSTRSGIRTRSSTPSPVHPLPVDPGTGRQAAHPKGVESVNTAWRVKAFRDYADHMTSSEFAEGLAELLGLAAHGRPVIMCSEAVPWRCHRRLITDALIVAGTDVEHIMSVTSTKPASLNENAVVRNGRLTYPAP